MSDTVAGTAPRPDWDALGSPVRGRFGFSLRGQ